MIRNKLVILTPEGVRFSFQMAGLASRCLALAIDLASIATISWTVSTALRIFSIVSDEIAGALLILSFFIIGISYGIILEWFLNGQTVGKRVLGIRVIDMDGMRLKFHQVAIRNLLRSLDSLPAFYFVGGIAVLASRRRQRLGDFVANTVVVKISTPEKPDFSCISSDKFNSLRKHPEIIGELRNRLPQSLMLLALKTAMRRDMIEAERRQEIFSELRMEIRKYASIPAEIEEDLSDERFVFNVIDVVLKDAGRW